MRFIEPVPPAASSVRAQIPFSPVGTFPSARHCGFRDISVEDQVWTEAWSHVARAIVTHDVGPLEDGGDCILLTVKNDHEGADTAARWLIWRDQGQFIVRRTATAQRPARYASIQDALQNIAALSDAERRSVAVLAEAMLMSLQESDAPATYALAA